MEISVPLNLVEGILIPPDKVMQTDNKYLLCVGVVYVQDKLQFNSKHWKFKIDGYYYTPNN